MSYILQIDLVLPKNVVDVSKLLTHQAWDVESVTCQRNVHRYEGSQYIEVEYKFFLRRKPGFVRDLYIIPAVIMAILVPIVFALPVTDTVRKYLPTIQQTVSSIENLTMVCWIA